MNMKCPYNFPHKSRKAIIEYLSGIGGYSERYERWPLEWNCKTYHADFDGDTLRKHVSTLAPAHDTKWDEWLANNQSAWEWWIEDARSYYLDGLYASYPGADQGDWHFQFAGRSGGHLVIESWRGNTLRGMNEDEFIEWLQELSWRDLVAFYRGVVCLCKDVTPRNAANEIEFIAANYREQLEDEWNSAIADSFAEYQSQLESMANV